MASKGKSKRPPNSNFEGLQSIMRARAQQIASRTYPPFGGAGGGINAMMQEFPEILSLEGQNVKQRLGEVIPDLLGGSTVISSKEAKNIEGYIYKQIDATTFKPFTAKGHFAPGKHINVSKGLKPEARQVFKRQLSSNIQKLPKAMSMPVNIPDALIEDLTSRFFGNKVGFGSPELGGAPYGIAVETSRGKLIHTPYTVGNIIPGLPKPVYEYKKEPTSMRLPEQLIKDPNKPYLSEVNKVRIGTKFELRYGMGRFIGTEGGVGFKKVGLSEELYNVVSAKLSQGGMSPTNIIRDVLDERSIGSEDPFAGSLRRFLGRYHVKGSGLQGGSYAGSFEEAINEQAPYKHLVSERMGSVADKARFINDEIWQKGLFTGYVKAEHIGKGILSRLPGAAYTPFGGFADKARQMYQTGYTGRMVPELIERFPSKLAGRKTTPALTTPVEWGAEQIRRGMYDVASGIQGKLGFVSKVTLPSGKVIPGEQFISTEMSDVILSPKLKEAMRLDISDKVKYMSDDPSMRFESYGVTSTKGQGTFGFFGNIKGGEIGTSRMLGTGGPGLGQLDALMGFYDLAKKAPDQYRRMQLAGIVAQIGALAPEDTPLGMHQRGLLNDIVDIVGKPSKTTMKLIGEPGAGYAEWMKGAEAKELLDTSWFAVEEGKKQFPVLSIGTEAAYESTEMKRVKRVVEQYSEKVTKLDLADPIDPRGFERMEVEIPGSGGAKMEIFAGVTKMSPRADLHHEQAIHRLARRIPGTPYSAFGGVKLSDLTQYNLAMRETPAGTQAYQMFKDVISNQPLESRKRVLDLTEMLSTISGQYKTTKAKSMIAREGELFFADVAAFKDWLIDKEVRKAIPQRLEGVSAIDQIFNSGGGPTIAGTDMYRKRVRIGIPTTELSIGKLERTASEIVIPSLESILEPNISGYMGKGEFQRPDLIGRVENLIELMHAEEQSAELGAKTKQAIEQLYEASIKEGLGKGQLEKVFKPRMAGSGVFALMGALSKDQQKSTQLLKSIIDNPIELGFGEIAMHPDDIKQLAGGKALKLARKRQLYGMSIAYPEQGRGNALGIRVLADSRVRRGGTAANLATTLAGFRDHDFDRLAVLLNFWSREQSPEDFNKFNKIMQANYEENLKFFGSAYRADNIEVAANTLINRYKQLEDPIAFAEDAASTMRELKHQLVNQDRARQLEALAEASSKSEVVGLMSGYAQRRADGSKVMGDYILESQLGTKEGTGQISNAMKSMKIAQWEMHRQNVAKYAMASGMDFDRAEMQFIKELAEQGTPEVSARRASFNFGTLLGYAEQQTIQKGEVANKNLMLALEEFYEDTSRTQVLRDAVGSIVEETTENLKRGKHSGGLPFIGADRNISGVIDELAAETAHVVKWAKNQGREPWDLGKASTLLKSMTEKEETAMVGELMEDLSRLQRGQTARGPFGSIIEKLGLFEAAETSTDVVPIQRGSRALSQATPDAPEPKYAEGAVTWLRDQTSKVWEWFTSKPKSDKVLGHYSKRVGAAAGLGMLGLAMVKNLIFPNFTPEPRESSYVDMAPPYGGMGAPMNMGGPAPGGGNMQAVYAPMNQSVDRPNHPVVMGPAAKAQPLLNVQTNPQSVSVMPPANPWSLRDAPTAWGHEETASFGKDIPVSTSEGIYDVSPRSIGVPSANTAREVSTASFGSGITINQDRQKTLDNIYNLGYNVGNNSALQIG